MKEKFILKLGRQDSPVCKVGII